jgi:hypothetical protein
MRVRSLISVATAALAFLAVPVSAAAAENSRVHLLYTFDSCDHGEIDCTQVIPDSSGKGNHGTVHRVEGGNLELVPGARGHGVQLSGALLRLENTSADEAFSPGTKAFSFGAMVKMDGAITGDANLMQRGRWSNETAQWKLELDAGHQGCSIKGDLGRVEIYAPTDLPVDGTFVADGRSYRAPNTVGSVTFLAGEQLYVGGLFNPDGTINDPFSLPIDNVFFAS